jgi:hypothetical protein
VKASDPPLISQMKLQFRKSEPMPLPKDKQRELAIALADLLLKAALVEPIQSDKGDRQ